MYQGLLCVGDGGRSGKKGWKKDMQKFGGGDKHVHCIDCVVGVWDIYFCTHQNLTNCTFFFFFLAMPLACGMLVPHLGIGPGLGQWKSWVLTTESSGNSQVYTLDMCCFFYVTNTLERCWKKGLGRRLSVRTWRTLKARLRDVGDPGVMGCTGLLQIEFGLEESTLVGRARNSPEGQSQGKRFIFFSPN